MENPPLWRFCRTTNSILYTNWHNETAVRRFDTRKVFFGVSPWHPEPQWLIEVYDEDKTAMRTYALSKLHPKLGDVLLEVQPPDKDTEERYLEHQVVSLAERWVSQGATDYPSELLEAVRKLRTHKGTSPLRAAGT